ncbi:MAG TPA: glycosyltransferase [Solirubrobacteraceae bacterium]|nr:glycosyltransferase [Solirubrobacteraceae bacterium]
MSGIEQRRAFLVATPGGHLDLLLALEPSFERFRRVWVVSPGSTADALAARGEEVRLLPRFHGLSLRNALRSVSGICHAMRDRPRLIVTSGSGSVVPYCLVSRMLGSHLVFLETMARIEGPSSTGRLLARVSKVVLVQWPEMRRFYPRARVCRPALLEGLPPARAPRRDGSGTFVSVGTHIDPFDRLLRIVDDAVDAGLLPRPVVAQSGVASYVPRNFETTPWMAPAKIAEHLRNARWAVCHAGSGLIARSLEAGLRPLVVPRRQHFGEHVDDHQLQITAKLGDVGIVVPVENEITARHLHDAVAERPAGDPFGGVPAMGDVLSEEIDRLLRAPNRHGPVRARLSKRRRRV